MEVEPEMIKKKPKHSSKNVMSCLNSIIIQTWIFFVLRIYLLTSRVAKHTISVIVLVERETSDYTETLVTVL